AGDDLTWKTNAWAHLATAAIGQGKFDQAVELAERAVAQNPLPDNAAGFAAILERARSRTRPAPQVLPPPGKPRDPVFGLVEAGDLAAAAARLGDPPQGFPRAEEARGPHPALDPSPSVTSWRVRRAALSAARFRSAAENHLDVAPRAR